LLDNASAERILRRAMAVESLILFGQIDWSREALEALPVIISLILIEGLLSVDNALAIAAMASHLPGKQKLMALRFGLIGAYVFRGLALQFASWITEHWWLKLIGALYLIYLACSHLSEDESNAAGGGSESGAPASKPGFWQTVIGIELMDLSLSVDNVVAAVALSSKLWLVMTGVFIGILVLRFLAGYCIRVIDKYPVLAKTAFLLVGFVGLLLVFELMSEQHVHAWQKFIGVLLITVVSIAYSRSPMAQKLTRPWLRTSQKLMGWFADIVESLFWPVRWCVRQCTRRWDQRAPKA
jgi:YkoY family integral membrane protein